MTEQEKQQREQLVAEARSWIPTPYRHMARVKHHGADCAMFPLEVFASLGLITSPPIEYYPLDWHLHRDAERYLDIVNQLAREVAPLSERTPLPGDFCVVKFGRCFAHGLIVVAWPLCIHSHLSHGVQLVDAERDPQLAGRPTKVFVLPGWSQDSPEAA
jgi:cell wall-associated NlpC family hydrolase